MMMCTCFMACTPSEDVPGDTVPDTEKEEVKDTEKKEEKPKETDPSKENTTKKEIDIYIIAGQSNGSGYTRMNVDELRVLWKNYNVGSPNVRYTGRAEYTNNVNTPDVSTGVNEYKTWVNAKMGQGKSSNHMGAEVGMAKVLSEEYYKTGTDNVAGIIKFAHGGTSLLNSLGGENAASGNWVSPSYAQEKNYTYSGLTGGLYRGLLKEVETKVDGLVSNGYKVNIKGLFWMQGESDRGNPAEYEKAFKHFVNDIRRDLGEIAGEDLSDLAIMIGEISRTSGSAVASTVATNEAFIEKQRELAKEIDNCYIIASGQYEINTLDANGNNTKDPYQNDNWHWNTREMFAIGELVGRCIIDNILNVSEAPETDNESQEPTIGENGNEKDWTEKYY